MEDHLESARRAIAIERTQLARAVPVDVLEVTLVSPRILAVRIETDRPFEPTAWTGGQLVWDRDEGAAVRSTVLRAEVVEVDADQEVLFVDPGPTVELPPAGPASLWPHDFLRAASALLHDARFEPLLPRLNEALEGVLRGELALEIGGPAGLDPAWAHDRVFVWGPPGTGKTHTLVEQALRLLDDPTERLLIVSTTNRATDEIALRLGERLRAKGGLHQLVRLGVVADPGAFRVRDLSEALPAQDDAALRQLEALRAEIASARSAGARAELQQALKLLLDGTPTLTSRWNEARDRCVVTTLHAALGALVSSEVADALLRGERPFTTIVIDEAGLVGRVQAAAASLLASRRVVLVGDPRQLSPIAKAARSMPRDVRRWIARSGLDHLEEDAVAPEVQRLWVQHRMHPEIRAVVSALSYRDRLTDAPGLAERPWGDAFMRRLPRAVWCVLDEHTDRPANLHSERGDAGISRRRPLALAVVEALVAAYPSLREADVLFVTPFRAQVQLVREATRRMGLRRWRASTVHAQQGSEADVVLFDTVHASSTAWPADEWVRLVNVGLSRAKHLVVVLASRAEMDQPFMRPLRTGLAPRALRRGRWEVAGPPPAELGSLFGVQPVSATPDDAGSGALPPADDDRLGAQIARRRALRPVMSMEQARLAHRELQDAGPRLVRGVAGSGKTLVLAHWVVRVLHGMRTPEVAIVYANKALLPLLQSVLDQVWAGLYPAPGALPWDRVRLVHVGELLRDLLRERGLPERGPDESPFDYDRQAARVLDAGEGDGRFPAVFVDEAQDLGHTTLRLLITLTAQDERGTRPILIFYDNAQNVYGRRAPRWRELGLDLRGRADVMKESFRTTRPNTELALDVLDRLRPIADDPDLRELAQADPPLLWRDAEGWWQAAFCSVDGVAPAVRIAETRQEELALITRQVMKWIRVDGVRPGDIRVLAMKNTRDALVAALRGALAPIPVEDPRAGGFMDCGDAVVVTTPHSFKGYDAELVVVAGVDGFHAEGRPLAAPLYVALTRARTMLLVTGTRTASGAGADVVRAVEGAAQRWGRGGV